MIIKKIVLYLFIFERERERERAWAGEGQRETESEAGSQLWAVSTEPNWGIKLTNREIMTWADVGRMLNWQSHPGGLV